MTFLKRLVTAIVLFVFFFVVVYFMICIVGAAVSGGMSAVNHPEVVDKAELGRAAGRDFVLHNVGKILLSSFGVSLIASIGLSFSGILPWCREPEQPPPVPPAVR
jgi:hypothetical protein